VGEREKGVKSTFGYFSVEQNQILDENARS